MCSIADEYKYSYPYYSHLSKRHASSASRSQTIFSGLDHRSLRSTIEGDGHGAAPQFDVLDIVGTVTLSRSEHRSRPTVVRRGGIRREITAALLSVPGLETSYQALCEKRAHCQASLLYSFFGKAM
jgi:hypothetical protein